MECRAIGYIVAETIWIRELLYHLGVTLSTLVRLSYDNLSATYMSAFSKHIPAGYYLVHERVVNGYLIQYIPTRLQTADFSTKGLSSQQFLLHRTNLSICPSN